MEKFPLVTKHASSCNAEGRPVHSQSSGDALTGAALRPPAPILLERRRPWDQREAQIVVGRGEPARRQRDAVRSASVIPQSRKRLGPIVSELPPLAPYQTLSPSRRQQGLAQKIRRIGEPHSRSPGEAAHGHRNSVGNAFQKPTIWPRKKCPSL
jgi:hypothetical protein